MAREQKEWALIRDAVTANDSALVDATKAWASLPSTVYRIPKYARAVILAWIGRDTDITAPVGDPENETITVKLYGYRTKGPAQGIGTYTLTVGDMEVGTAPWPSGTALALANYVDTIVETAGIWHASNRIDQETDGLATLSIKLYDIAALYVEYSSITAEMVWYCMGAFVEDLPG